ncbi:FAD binding domain-containing protein [Sulfobacillus thermosulfidooxidans]|uniref:FAD binding domain-containing protein n=1 Tax=Sulfobacillus thermosulfidooxidans TaxID=28034 RepID=UPI0006B5D40C|nr:FAD binding domain-containing protein [Sulfobacillus thermosulfidooxidans]
MRWIEPSTIEEVQTCLAQHVPIIGGGTWLLQDGHSPQAVCDLTAWAGILGIKRDEQNWTLGPNITLNAWQQALGVNHPISQILSLMGSPAFRRVATVIGVIANPQPVADLYPLLRLLQSSVRYIDTTHVDIQNDVLDWPESAQERAIVGVKVPEIPKDSRVYFRKYAKGRMTRPLINFTVIMTPQGSHWKITFMTCGLSPWPLQGSACGTLREVDQAMRQWVLDREGVNRFYQALILNMWQDIYQQWWNENNRGIAL